MKPLTASIAKRRYDNDNEAFRINWQPKVAMINFGDTGDAQSQYKLAPQIDLER